MNNIMTIISYHNKKSLRQHNKCVNEKIMFNCRTNNSCPLSNKCLQKNVIYRATVKSELGITELIGSTGNIFKSRWYGPQ